MLLLFEFFTYQIFVDYLWCLLSMVWLCFDIFQLITFYFYHHYFIIITIFNIIITQEIIYSYMFIIILLFFFILKKVPNISSYLICICFIFFFQSIKYLVSLTVVSSISFLNLKEFIMSLIVFHLLLFFSLIRYLTSLIMLSSIFFVFFKPWTFHYYMLWKKPLIFFQKMKVYYIPWKSAWKYYP